MHKDCAHARKKWLKQRYQTLLLLVVSSPNVTMLEGYALEITLTTANAAAQAWYGYDQVRPMICR